MEKQNKKQPELVIHDFTLVAPDRNRKDVGKLKSAIQRAESIQFPSRVALYDLYHDILTIDGHLSGIIQKRVDAVKNKSIKFVDKNKRKVDALDTLIWSNKFNRLVEVILESKFWGISGVEFIQGEKFDFEEIERKHIRPEMGIITKSQYDSTGIPIDTLPYVWTIGGKRDLGRLLQCSMYAIYKRAGFGDFAQYVEIFGQPVRIIYYNAYDTKTQEELRKLLNESGGSLTMMIPEQAKFQMLDGKTSNGDGKLQTSLIQACNAEMSIAILGNTETTSSSSGSGYAQAKIQAGQQLEITKSDITFVQNILNEGWFLKILKSYGYPVEGGSFEFELEVDLDELQKRLDIDEKVSEKVPVDDDYWYNTYGIPKPDNYEELKTKQEEREKLMQEFLNKKQENNEDVRSDGAPTNKNLFDRFIDFFVRAPRKRGADLEF